MILVLIIIIFFASVPLPDSMENQQIGFQDLVTPIMQGFLDLQLDLFIFMLISSATIIYLIRSVYYFYYTNITLIL